MPEELKQLLRDAGFDPKRVVKCRVDWAVNEGEPSLTVWLDTPGVRHRRITVEERLMEMGVPGAD